MAQYTSRKEERFIDDDGLVAKPLYVILRILRIKQSVDRELKSPVVTLTDSKGLEFSGKPGEGVWDLLRRTKLLDRAQIDWKKATTYERKQWMLPITHNEQFGPED